MKFLRLPNSSLAVAALSLAVAGCATDDISVDIGDDMANDVATEDPTAPSGPARPAAAAANRAPACVSMPALASRTAVVNEPASQGVPAMPFPVPECQLSTVVLPALKACTAANHCINVKEAFGGQPGALGNGIVDDTAAIQRAVDRLEPSGILYFPAGTYLIDSTFGTASTASPGNFGIQFVGKRDIQVVGAGSNQSVIKDAFAQEVYDNDGRMTRLAGTATMLASLRFVGGSNVVVANLGFVSAPGYSCTLDSYAGNVEGVRAEGVAGFTIFNSETKYYNRAGVHLAKNAQSTPTTNSKVAFNLMQQNRVAGLLLGDSDNTRVEQNRFYNNGRYGDGGTGYGSAGLSSELAHNVTELCNLADYNIRKGIDFHSGADLNIYRNYVVASGVAGFFISGSADFLGGAIKLHHNNITGMNPDVSQTIHGLESTREVVAIWAYPKFLRPSATAPKIEIFSNRITNFTTKAMPGIARNQQFTPFQLRSEAYSNASYDVHHNTIVAGSINQLINTAAGTIPDGMPALPDGQQSISFHDNTFTYKAMSRLQLILLSQAAEVSAVNNVATLVGHTSNADAWDDAKIQQLMCANSSARPALAMYISAPPLMCASVNNQWLAH
jgi:parallel beta-helix repeat protein